MIFFFIDFYYIKKYIFCINFPLYSMIGFAKLASHTGDVYAHGMPCELALLCKCLSL